jgi:ribosomal protein S18 acetylase RimI-like enzyme
VRAIPRGESEAVQQADHADSTPGFASLQSAPEFHHQGCGRRLVRHAQELHGELTTDINEQNLAARRFYEACGFVVGAVGVRRRGAAVPAAAYAARHARPSAAAD